INLKDIERITAKVNPKAQNVLIYDNPKSPAEGKFSMQYCLSSAALDHTIDLSTFTEEKFKRQNIQELMNKIVMEVDEEQVGVNKETHATITIQTERKKFNTVIKWPIGHPKNPLTENQINYKVTECLGSRISSDEINNFIDVCKHLQEYDSDT